MKFAANISTMFTDMVMSDRFNEAAEYGFKDVEVQFLYKTDALSNIIEAMKKIEPPRPPINLVLMNSPKEPGPLFPNDDLSGIDPELRILLNYATGTKSMLNIVHKETDLVNPLGLACLPGYEEEFGNSITACLRLCDLMQCHKLHIVAGKIPENAKFDDYEKIYLSNLSWAADAASQFNVTLVIEPICWETQPNYFLHSFEQAIDYMGRINQPNLKLLLDVYHLFKIEQDVEAGLKKYLPHAAHIQISQSPGRIDPFKKGDIDYAKVLDIIRNSSYDGHIGLEYFPVDPEPDFSWMKDYTE